MESQDSTDEDKSFREEDVDEFIEYSTTPMRMFDMNKKHIDIIQFNNEQMTIKKFQKHLTDWLYKI